jgi:hypothetical protein
MAELEDKHIVSLISQEWGRMSIVDTKAFMLPPARRSISGHKLLVIGIPV